MLPFRSGQQYSRKDVFRVVGINDPGGGDWYTGYAAHGDDFFIFCGVGTAGRTGHDYGNHFVGDELIWSAKTKTHLMQPQIQRLIHPKGDIHIFYREVDRDPFTYAGLGRPIEIKDISPVQIRWAFSSEVERLPVTPPEEIGFGETVVEGARKTISVNIYERDPNARRKCILVWGAQCVVCGFDFEAAYGELGRGYIHVHHLKPLSEIGSSYLLDPIADLRPVCPNCHAMLHRTIPPKAIDELKAVLEKKA